MVKRDRDDDNKQDFMIVYDKNVDGRENQTQKTPTFPLP